MIKRIKAQINMMKETYNAAVRLKMYPSVVFPSDSFMGRSIFHHNDSVRGNGMLFALVDNNQNIWVDDNFYRLSEESREAILAHEIGHIENGHTEVAASEAKHSNIKRSLSCLFKSTPVDEREVEADLYAANKFGARVMINALEEMKAIMKENYINTKEIDKRIAILKGYNK